MEKEIDKYYIGHPGRGALFSGMDFRDPVIKRISARRQVLRYFIRYCEAQYHPYEDWEQVRESLIPLGEVWWGKGGSARWRIVSVSNITRLETIKYDRDLRKNIKYAWRDFFRDHRYCYVEGQQYKVNDEI